MFGGLQGQGGVNVTIAVATLVIVTVAVTDSVCVAVAVAVAVNVCASVSVAVTIVVVVAISVVVGTNVCKDQVNSVSRYRIIRFEGDQLECQVDLRTSCKGVTVTMAVSCGRLRQLQPADTFSAANCCKRPRSPVRLSRMRFESRGVYVTLLLPSTNAPSSKLSLRLLLHTGTSVVVTVAVLWVIDISVTGVTVTVSVVGVMVTKSVVGVIVTTMVTGATVL